MTRYTVKPASSNNHVPYRVYDEVMQIVVFHWHGNTGQAKCEAVAAALNALGHERD